MKKYRQHDERDCGAACFATILSYWGSHITLQEARKIVNLNMQGTNVYNIVSAGRKMLLETDAYQANYEEVVDYVECKKIVPPFIVHMITENDMEHFMVVLRINKKNVKVFDPAKGIVKYSKKRFCLYWTGCIIAFSKKRDYVPIRMEKKKSVYKDIIKKIWFKYLVAIILSSLIVCISLIGTLGFEVVVDNIIYGQHELQSMEHENIILDLKGYTNYIEQFGDKIMFDEVFNNIRLISKVLIGLYIIQFFLQFLRDIVVAVFSRNIEIDIMKLYMEKIFDLPFSFFQNITSGELLSRFSDLSEIRNLVSGYSLSILFNCIVLVLGFVMMILINPILFFLMLIVAGTYALLIIGFSFSVSKINTQYLSKNAKMITDFKELVDGIDTIKFCDGRDTIRKKLNSDFYDVAKIGLFGNIVYGLQNAISVVLESMSVIIALVVGAELVKTGTLTVGYLMTFSMLISYILFPIKDLVEIQPTIQKALVSFYRLNDVVYADEESISGIKDNDKITGDIVFSDVSFSYLAGIPVIEHLNISINAKEKVMIKGGNGIGKSTIIKLLLAAYEPTHGQITINGYNVDEFSLKTLRENIIYIPQNVYIFSETIKTNIILNNSNIDKEEVERVLEIVGLKEFVDQLPKGIETYLYENGYNLSGGQKQKIAIARALIKKPKVLVLDETLSQIDERTCVQIIEKIFDFYTDTTCILISHNNELVKVCDKVISLD